MAGAQSGWGKRGPRALVIEYMRKPLGMVELLGGGGSASEVVRHAGREFEW